MVNFDLWSKESDDFSIPSLIIPLGVNSGRGNKFMRLGLGERQPFRVEAEKTMYEIAVYGLLFQGGFEVFLFPSLH